MRVLVTGGSGFIGRHLIETLRGSYTIVAPSHQELDVTDASTVDNCLLHGRFDAIIHAAVEGGERVLESTLRGYWNLARHANRVDRLIYFGSGAEYGKHRDLVRVHETAIGEQTPKDPYGLAKMICTSLCRSSPNIVNLRLFGVFGEYEGYRAKFISNAVAKALVGLPLIVRQDVVFDYLWVDDLMRILPILLEGERKYADLNVTPSTSVTLTEVARLVLEKAQAQIEFSVETPGMNFQYTGDNERLLETVGEFNFTPISEGVRRLVSYYRSRLASIDRAVLVEDNYRRRVTTRLQATTGTETNE